MSTASAAPEAATTKTRNRTLALVLAGLSFAFHLWLALTLDAVQSLDQFDVFFHADTQARLACVVEGACGGRSSISHPALDLFVNPPVRLAAKASRALGGFGADEAAARHGLALLVSPLAAGVEAGLVFMLFTALGLSWRLAGLAGVLASISFSGLIFGSIPESFALSSCAIAAGFWMAARTPTGRAPNFYAWLALATFATGVTVTNLASILLLFAAAHANTGEAPSRIALRGVSLTLGCAALTALLSLTSQALYESRPLSLEAGARYIEKWSENNEPSQRLAWFPTALANSSVGTPPTLAPNYQAQRSDSRYKFRFSFEGSGRALTSARPLATLLLLLSVLGGAVMLRGTHRQRSAAIAALAILLFNALLHAFWGVGHFLYSQHWQLAFSLLLAGPLFAASERRFARAATTLVFGMTAAIAIQNAAVLRLLLAHFSLPGAP